MKGLWLILRYFYTWQRILPWFVGAGLLGMVVIYVQGQFLPNNNLTVILAFAGGFVLLFPYCMLPGSFRFLIANRQLSLIPYFQLKTGVVVLLYTLVVAAYYSSIGVLEELPLTPLLLFCAASFWTGVMQLSVSLSRRAPWLPFLIVGGFLLLMFNGPIIFGILQDEKVTVVLTLISILGWGKGLHMLATQRNFSPAAAGYSDSDLNMNSVSQYSRLKFDDFKSAGEVLLTNFPDGLAKKIQIKFFTLLFIPAVIAGGIQLFLQLVVDPRTETMPFLQMFLCASFFMIVISSLMYTEFPVGARRVWLRQGSDRKWQWRKIEEVVCLDLFLTAVIIMSISLSLIFLADFNLFRVVPGVILLLLVAALNVYFGMVIRIYRWSALVSIGGLLLVTTLLIVVGMMIVKSETFGVSIMGTLVSVALLIVVARFFAKKGFSKINWLVVKPVIVHRDTSGQLIVKNSPGFGIASQ